MSVSAIQIQEFKQKLAAKGQSQMDWAKQHNVNYNILQMFMQGRLKGTRGEAHRVAVAMGFKEAA